MDPRSYSIVLQYEPDVDFAGCWGFPAPAAAQPTQILVVEDPNVVPFGGYLAHSLRRQFAEDTNVKPEPCEGPGIVDLLPVGEDGVRRLLVVVAGIGPPSPALSEFVAVWA